MWTALLVALPLLVAAIGYWRHPTVTKRWFDRLVAFRRILFVAFALLVAVVLIGSGVPSLMFLGGVGLAYGGLYVLYKEPHKEVQRWLGI
jgi:hypothetical protein